MRAASSSSLANEIVTSFRLPKTTRTAPPAAVEATKSSLGTRVFRWSLFWRHAFVDARLYDFDPPQPPAASVTPSETRPHRSVRRIMRDCLTAVERLRPLFGVRKLRTFSRRALLHRPGPPRTVPLAPST